MLVCGQYFNSEVLSRIQTTVEEDSSISRRALSRLVCEWLDWRGANGKLQDMSCRKALLKLQRKGLITLPDTKKGVFLPTEILSVLWRTSGYCRGRMQSG